MAVKQALYLILWSPRSSRDYYAIMDSIRAKFGDAALQKFVRRTIVVLEHISRNPGLFRASEKYRNKRIALVTKQTTLYFKVKPRNKEVELLLFWDSRRNPKKLPY